MSGQPYKPKKWHKYAYLFMGVGSGITAILNGMMALNDLFDWRLAVHVATFSLSAVTCVGSFLVYLHLKLLELKGPGK